MKVSGFRRPHIITTKFLPRRDWFSTRKQQLIWLIFLIFWVYYYSNRANSMRAYYFLLYPKVELDDDTTGKNRRKRWNAMIKQYRCFCILKVLWIKKTTFFQRSSTLYSLWLNRSFEFLSHFINEKPGFLVVHSNLACLSGMQTSFGGAVSFLSSSNAVSSNVATFIHVLSVNMKWSF